MKTFFIEFMHPRTRKRYGAKVEITYQIDKIIKFRISAGAKSITMDKHLYRKYNQWQTGITNFNPSLELRDKNKMLSDIRKLIDERLANG